MHQFKPISRSAMLTIAFFFGLGILAFWCVTNIFNKDFSPDKSILGLIGYILTTALYGFKKDNDDGDKGNKSLPDSTETSRGKVLPGSDIEDDNSNLFDFTDYRGQAILARSISS